MEVVFQPARLNRATNCARLLSVAGLETQQPSWRIRDPQAVTKPGKICTIHPNTGVQCLCLPLQQYLGAWVGSQRKRPRCAFLGLALSCGYPIRLGLFKSRKFNMIYTFIIARPGQKLSQLKRIRTVSAFGRTEAEARRAFKGLPLVLKSRTQDNQEDAA
tara:strand:- start:10605 stop:11084 length:480 start_codon:yes stop_codon:yes gene_type:complete